MQSPPKLNEVLPPRLPAHLLLSAIVASSQDAIISNAVDGTVTSWNAAAERIFGYQAEEIIGTSIFRLVPPELLQEERDLAAKSKAGHHIEHYETRRRRKDGGIVFISLAISPVHDNSREVVGTATVARDITEQRAAQAARGWLAAIVDSSDDAIIGKDLNGIITSWNIGAARIFGYDEKEIVGKSVLTLIPPEQHGDEALILEQLKRGERVDHFETTRVRKDGSKVQVSLTISPIADAAGNLVGASKIARDITAQLDAGIAMRRLAAIVDSSDDGIIGKDLTGIITNWNSAATRIFGYEPKEIIGRSVLTLIPPSYTATKR